jgi:plastocyanin
MRHMMLLVSGVLATSMLAGCGSDSTMSPTSPTTPTSPAPAPGGGSTGGGSTGSGSTGATPNTAAVTVGDIFFKSARNGSSNPAVDTVAVNGTVTWTWATTEALPHSVLSVGSPSFTSSAIQSGAGKTYTFTFTAPGTYQYECAVHGPMMTGTIVVLGAAAPTSSAPMPPTPGYP